MGKAIRVTKLAYKDLEKKRATDRAYREKNKEKLKLYRREYYQKNKEKELQKMRSYAQNITGIKEYQKKHYQEIRLEVLAKINPEMKCARCGCDDPRFLEINHITGGGRKEKKRFKEMIPSQNFVQLIYTGKRSVEDLNLLCRICNSIDHLERVYGHTGLRVVWDKPDTKIIHRNRHGLIHNFYCI